MVGRVEPRAIHEGAVNGGPDIEVYHYLLAGSRKAFIELAVVNPLVPSFQGGASRQPLFAAKAREAAKRAKYAEMAATGGYTLVGAAVETTGAFGPGLMSVLESASTRAGLRLEGVELDDAVTWAANSYWGYWPQRIGVALVEGAYPCAPRAGKSAVARARLV